MASALYTDYYQLNEAGRQRVMALLSQNPSMPMNVPQVVEQLPGADLQPIVRGPDANLDRAIYYWQNKLRTDPNDFLEPLRKFEGEWTPNGRDDDADAVSKAIKELESRMTNRLPALEWNEGLNLAAKDHCQDLGPTGMLGHFGTDQSSPFDRISRYGKPGWWRGENLMFMDTKIPVRESVLDREAKNIVMKLFVDEGLAGRPSRHRMLNPEFKMVGIYTCPHKKDGSRSMTVIDYAGTLETNEATKQGVM